MPRNHLKEFKILLTESSPRPWDLKKHLNRVYSKDRLVADFSLDMAIRDIEVNNARLSVLLVNASDHIGSLMEAYAHLKNCEEKGDIMAEGNARIDVLDRVDLLFRVMKVLDESIKK